MIKSKYWNHSKENINAEATINAHSLLFALLWYFVLRQSSSDNNTINIWSIKKGVKFSTLEWTQPSDSINKNVWSLDYSVDGTILCSASGDGRLRLWDAAIVQKQTTRKAADFEPHLKTPFQNTLYNTFSNTLPKTLFKTFSKRFWKHAWKVPFNILFKRAF